MEQVDLFGAAVVPPVQGKSKSNQTAIQNHKQLIAIHGTSDGNKCKDCAFLYYKQYAGKYFKCKKADPTLSSGPAGDWRCKWQACGLFELSND